MCVYSNMYVDKYITGWMDGWVGGSSSKINVNMVCGRRELTKISLKNDFLYERNP